MGPQEKELKPLLWALVFALFQHLFIFGQQKMLYYIFFDIFVAFGFVKLRKCHRIYIPDCSSYYLVFKIEFFRIDPRCKVFHYKPWSVPIVGRAALCHRGV